MKTVTLATVMLVAAAHAFADRPGKTVGVYHWGSQVPRSVSEGVHATVGLGGRVVRLTLSPRHDADYAGARDCNPALTLAMLAQRDDLRKAFEEPGMDVYILTAYDSIGLGDCVRPPYLRLSFYTPETERAIAQEYSDLTLYLYRTYAGTRKRFIIANWESDNAVYCANAYGYAFDPIVRQTCDRGYVAQYGNRSPEESLEALQKWFTARYLGVLDGKARAAAEGIGGSRVYVAAEINIVRALRAAGLKSVLYDVLPLVGFDYVSYSSWESINAFDAGEQLERDLSTIERVAGTSAVIVGEMGYSRTFWGGEGAARKLAEIIRAALNWGAAYVIVWNLYDQPGGEYGLIATDGTVTPLGASFRDQAPQRPVAATNGEPPAIIGAQ